MIFWSVFEGKLVPENSLGNFTEGSLDATISAITKDEKIQRTLKKKLKGKYEKDTETLMKLVGLSEQEASDWLTWHPK